MVGTISTTNTIEYFNDEIVLLQMKGGAEKSNDTISVCIMFKGVG